MFYIGAYDASRVFRPERERLSLIALSTAAIFPREHLLRNNVGLLTHAAREQFGGFENRRADFVKVISAEDIAHSVFDEIPQRRVWRQQIAGSSGRFDHCMIRYSSCAARDARPNRSTPAPGA